MASSQFRVGAFKGLRLGVNPQDLGLDGAVDLLNVDFDRPNAVRTRAGTAKWNSNTLSSTGYQAMFRSPTHGGEFILIRGISGGAAAVDRMPDGGAISNVGSLAFLATPIAATSLGTPTSSTIYFTVFTTLTTGQTIRKYDGTTLGTGAGKPKYVAASPTSNRLVQGGYFAAADSPTGANGSASTVFFSDAGAPDTYGANNFVDLRPGDGEGLTGIVTWREQTFVFKESGFYVFSGEGLSQTGTPTFPRRRVDLPTPILDPLGTTVPLTFIASGPDAVYFSTTHGIYRTAGGPPELISGDISGAFSGAFSVDPSVGSSIRTNGSPPALAWCGDRLIASFTNAAGAVRQFVYHAPTRQWSLWALAGTSFTPSSAHLGGDALLIGDGFWFVSGNDVWTCTPIASSDAGVAIPWSYKTGAYSPADGVAVIPETSLLGTGTVSLRLDSDLYTNQNGSATLGTAPTLGEGWPAAIDQEGTWLQATLSGSGPASVSEMVHYISSVKTGRSR